MKKLFADLEAKWAKRKVILGFYSTMNSLTQVARP
jgi:hypothetical protein